jgi:AcrR family transcriptional regulator
VVSSATESTAAESTPQIEVPVVKRGRGRPRDEGADERILSAAASLMLENGITGITVDEVASMAGVGKATVYRRYPTKDTMAAQALKRLFGSRMSVPDTGAFRTDMIAVYEQVIAFASSTKGHAFLRLAANAATRSRKAADMYRTAYEERRDQFGVIIDRAIERGELERDIDRQLFLDTLPALLMFRVVTNQPLPPIEASAQYIDRMIHALEEAGDKI